MTSRMRSEVGDRISSTVAPSAMNTTRSACAAASGIVGDHDDRLTEVLDGGAEETEQLCPGSRIEVARGLVREDDVRTRDQRARRGDALLLATRELAGSVLEAVAESDRRHHVVEQRRVSIGAGNRQGKGDVVERVQRGHEVEALEDETDASSTQQGQLRVLQATELGVTDEHLSRREGVETGHAMQKCRLA